MGLGLRLGLSGLLSSAYSPLSLFTLAEPGVWYDPSDLTTMFQDTAGTTPVTTPGQTVALALDKSKGLVKTKTTVPTLNVNEGNGATTISQAGNVLTFTSSASGDGKRINGHFALAARTFVRVTCVGTGIVNIFAGSSVPVACTNSGSFVAGAGSSDQAFLIFRAGTGGYTGTVTVEEIFEQIGNHATQSTAASRPTYGIVPSGGRRNLLTFTEQFDNAIWVKSVVTVASSVDVPSQGPTTAFLLRPTTDSAGNHTLTQTLSAAGTVTQSVYAKASGYNFFGVTFDNSAAKSVRFNLSTGSVTTAGGSATGSIVSVGNGWYRISVTTTLGASSVAWYSLPTDGYSVFAGDGVSGTLIAGAQLETGSTATAYQRVGSAFDVTEAGVASLSYLSFDGVDDFLVTPTITPGVDKAQVFAGVRKLSDAAVGVLAEFSASWIGNIGSFILTAPGTTAPSGNYDSASRGNIAFNANQGAATGTIAAPVTNVITATHDIAGDLTAVRSNGVQLGTATGDKGTGNFLAYPLYIGRRAGTSLPFNGNIFSLIVRFGANLDASTITNTETWVGGKTGSRPVIVGVPTIGVA